MHSFLGFSIFEIMAVFTGDIPSLGYESSTVKIPVSLPDTALNAIDCAFPQLCYVLGSEPQPIILYVLE